MTLPQWSPSDREMNSWAIRSFRDVADADYISARLACRAQLPVQFLWASQQALEKYLKCILFLHRIEAKKVKHDIRVALKLVEESGLDLDLNEGSKKFIGEAPGDDSAPGNADQPHTTVCTGAYGPLAVAPEAETEYGMSRPSGPTIHPASSPAPATVLAPQQTGA